MDLMAQIEKMNDKEQEDLFGVKGHEAIDAEHAKFIHFVKNSKDKFGDIASAYAAFKKDFRGREGKTYGKAQEDVSVDKEKMKNTKIHKFHLSQKDKLSKMAQDEKDELKRKGLEAKAKNHEYYASVYESRLTESEFYHTKALSSYLETMLWSTNDNSDERGGDPLDKNYDTSDIDPELIEQSKKDITAFYEKAGDILDRYDDKRIGHDFWLTRNRHGAGFWDGDYEEVEGDGDKLTEIAQSLGQIDPYVGDDGKIYA